MLKRNHWLITGFLVLLAGLARAQEPSSMEDRVRALERENRLILERLQRSERRNAELEGEVKGLTADTNELMSEQRDDLLEEQVNALTARYGEEDWTTATRSGLPIRFYGFLRLDAYFNTAKMTDPIIPFAVLPEGGSFGRNDSQFALDVRLTRFGIDLNAGKIGQADTTGKLEIDFANFPAGSTESRETPRIRLAYINLDFGEITLRLGQDWDVISPLYPAVHAELLLWGAGNLGDRRPMVQFLWNTGDPDGVTFDLELAAGFPGAVDGADNDGLGGRTNLDGVDSGLPQGQARLALGFPSWVDGKRATIGVSGHLNELETDLDYGGDDSFVAWSVGADVVLPLFGGFSLRGEVWIGQAHSDVRGAILQDINTLTGDEIQSWGGWIELHWQASENFRLAIGGSIDDPDNDDLNALVVGESRELNWTLFVSSKLDWGGGLVSGLDVIYWETHWAGDGVGNAVRINFWTALYF